MSCSTHLLIHGGCSNALSPDYLTKEEQNAAKEALKVSLLTGFQVLQRGGSAVDSVVEAIKIMEDCPIFSAGKGSAFTSEGINECDAGIMDGNTGLAGGVSTLTKVKNPITLAVEVMRKTPHALLCGAGAEKFAKSCGITTVDPSYFWTERKTQLWGRALQGASGKPRKCSQVGFDFEAKGTVGAVALDCEGHLAGGSSTGGLMDKLPGRVSDSAVVGAGFYANSLVALSGTGDGDYFIRRGTCKRVADLVELAGMKLGEACESMVTDELKECTAGLIAVSSNGDVTMPFNTPGMFRGAIDERGDPWVAIF